MMSLPRLQLVELEDLPWFPRTLRDLATDYLEFIEARVAMPAAVVPLLRRVLDQTGAMRVVDLCSGGGGPVGTVQALLAAEGVRVEFVLTDKYPNREAFRRLARASTSITFIESSVDATAVPRDLRGIRTMFNAFHHFGPDDAREILRAAAAAGQPLAIFELSERSVRSLLSILLTPLAVWLGTPFIRPFRWDRLLWTYLVPLVPLTCLWDGVVSQWRAYTVSELEELTRGLGVPRYGWEVGRVAHAFLPAHVTFVIGLPTGVESFGATAAG